MNIYSSALLIYVCMYLIHSVILEQKSSEDCNQRKDKYFEPAHRILTVISSLMMMPLHIHTAKWSWFNGSSSVK